MVFESIVTLENSVSGAYDSDQILSLLELVRVKLTMPIVPNAAEIGLYAIVNEKR